MLKTKDELIEILASALKSNDGDGRFDAGARSAALDAYGDYKTGQAGVCKNCGHKLKDHGCSGNGIASCQALIGQSVYCRCRDCAPK